ncbi:retention module-containing protein, partial [Marinobacter oulmenensis]
MANARIQIINAEGSVTLVSAEGEQSLASGDVVQIDGQEARIVTGENGQVTLLLNGDPLELGPDVALSLPEGEEVEGDAGSQFFAAESTDAVVDALSSDQDLLDVLEAPAAGTAGGAAGGGHDFVRLLRVSEIAQTGSPDFAQQFGFADPAGIPPAGAAGSDSATGGASQGGTAIDPGGSADTTPPTLTLDVPGPTNDTTPTINGTSDEIGGTVTVVITDANGQTQELEATVDADGNWSVDADDLPEGGYDVDASITDAAGNEATASGTGTVDTTAPGESGGSDGNAIEFDDADGEINATEQSNVTFTGAVEDGATVNGIVITDGQGGSVTVDPSDISVGNDGTVTVSGQDLSGLTDGELTVTMTVTDAAGNQGQVDDTATLDATAGDLSVSGTVDNAAQTVDISGSS